MTCFRMQNIDESPVYISIIAGGIGFNFAEIILTADQDGEMMTFNVTIGNTCDTATGSVNLQTPSVPIEKHEPAPATLPLEPPVGEPSLPLEPAVGEHGDEHPHNSTDVHSDPTSNAIIANETKLISSEKPTADEIPIAQAENEEN